MGKRPQITNAPAVAERALPGSVLGDVAGRTVALAVVLAGFWDMGVGLFWGQVRCGASLGRESRSPQSPGGSESLFLSRPAIEGLLVRHGVDDGVGPKPERVRRRLQRHLPIPIPVPEIRKIVVVPGEDRELAVIVEQPEVSDAA